jgi:hypothetical protein
MSAKSATELLGWEFDWLGCDVDDHVALFSTAGGGYVPDEVLRDTDAHGEAIDAILGRSAAINAQFVPKLGFDCTDIWKNVAERGLFVFDADVNGGPYSLIAAPLVAVRVGQLPAIVGELLRRVALRHLRFADLSVVSEQTLRPGG